MSQQFCPRQLADNYCAVVDCPRAHDISSYCHYCNRLFASSTALESHCTGQAHKQRQKLQIVAVPCVPCQLILGSESEYRQHAYSGSHRSCIARLDDSSIVGAVVTNRKISIAPVELHSESGVEDRTWQTVGSASSRGALQSLGGNIPATKEEEYEVHARGKEAVETECTLIKSFSNYQDCVSCGFPVLLCYWETHVASIGHRRAETRSGLDVAMREAEQAQYGVMISPVEEDIDFGTVRTSSLKEGQKIVWTIMAISKGDSEIIFESTRLTLPHAPCFAVRKGESVILGKKSVPIASVILKYRGRQGHFANRVELHFQETASKKRFMITRELRAVIEPEANSAIATSYDGHLHHAAPTADVLLGEPRQPLRFAPWTEYLEAYELPQLISSALSKGSLGGKIGTIQEHFMPRSLRMESYINYWQVLLHVEEHQLIENLRSFRLTNVPLNQHGRYHFLSVPGLGDNRLLA
ncbi:hypothetical protein BOTBODRAFT_247876 [Botryobasidium botryosum FD-172 SS1]|uniref:C2H2-type domain-containing protein n=1 Tax=Botryobasidium botryosum (strain FD-172 SS1) TaxID=930990 RepID=A0A067LTR4_BOTB1|nr:hypothetical protein BOTBODRAFT_247876 [Botryobasidium botryosum FD-172 SS1]